MGSIREDPLEEGTATHSSILPWRIPMVRGAWGATGHPGVCDGQGGLVCCDSWGRKESDMTERLI